MDIILGFQQYLRAETLQNINPNTVYLILFTLIFSKSGIIVGVFIPGGNSLLLTAGILASQNFLNIITLILTVAVASVTGDIVGYLFGRKVGRRLFNREKSLIFHKDYLIKAEDYYKLYGSITIVLAKFLPVIRTFAPVVAGIGKMDSKRFIAFSILGSFLWGSIISLIGYLLGSLIPDIENNLDMVVLIVFIATITPPLIHLVLDKDHRKQLSRVFKSS